MTGRMGGGAGQCHASRYLPIAKLSKSGQLGRTPAYHRAAQSRLCYSTRNRPWRRELGRVRTVLASVHVTVAACADVEKGSRIAAGGPHGPVKLNQAGPRAGAGSHS